MGRRPSSACGAVATSGPEFLSAARTRRQRAESWSCSAAAEPGPGPDSVISGYTPANYISFSENEKDVAAHAFEIDVDAPATVCFSIWNDWNRLVEFLDLVAQIGLDANNPDLALFQCFYRHGLLPVMEIVFVLQKTEVVPDKRIAFESVWGMPMTGSVAFKQLRSGKTRVRLSFSQSLPDLLVDLKVGVFGVQNSLIPILSDNMHAFRDIAEAAARDPAALPPREEGGERAYPVFDEEADLALFQEIMESYQLDEDEDDEEEDEEAAAEGQRLQGEEDEDKEQQPGSSGAAEPSLLGTAAARGQERDFGGEDLQGGASSSSGAGASASTSKAGAAAAAGARRAGSRAAADSAGGVTSMQRAAVADGKGAGRVEPVAEPVAPEPPSVSSGGARRRVARSRGAT